MLNRLFMLLIGIAFVGCSNEPILTTGPSLSEPLHILVDNALSQNDTVAYNEISMCNWLERVDGMLHYSLIMANKNKYPQAYFDVYYYLIKQDYSSLSETDVDTRNMAIKYLCISVKMRNEYAMTELMEYLSSEGEDYKILNQNTHFIDLLENDSLFVETGETYTVTVSN